MSVLVVCRYVYPRAYVCVCVYICMRSNIILLVIVIANDFDNIKDILGNSIFIDSYKKWPFRHVSYDIL